MIRCVEVPEPEPGPGEVRLRVQAAALGLPDVLMCRAAYAFAPPLPFVPGQEVCGTVDAVGDGVQVPAGTRLMATTSFIDGRGGLAEATIARADGAFRVPEDMDAVEAAGFRIGFSTAWIGLVRRAQLQAGEWLLVLGAAGGSGVAAVQLGRALGARVVAVARGEDKLALCRRAGAEVAIDRSEPGMAQAVLELTDGGAGVVYDPVGGEAAAEAFRCTARGGRFLLVGFASGDWARIDPAQLVRRNISLVGVYAGGFTREQNAGDHEQLLDLAGRGLLGGLTNAVPFDSVPAAMEAIASGTAVGKHVVTVEGVGR